MLFKAVVDYSVDSCVYMALSLFYRLCKHLDVAALSCHAERELVVTKKGNRV